MPMHRAYRWPVGRTSAFHRKHCDQNEQKALNRFHFHAFRLLCLLSAKHKGTPIDRQLSAQVDATGCPPSQFLFELDRFGRHSIRTAKSMKSFWLLFFLFLFFSVFNGQPMDDATQTISRQSFRAWIIVRQTSRILLAIQLHTKKKQGERRRWGDWGFWLMYTTLPKVFFEASLTSPLLVPLDASKWPQKSFGHYFFFFGCLAASSSLWLGCTCLHNKTKSISSRGHPRWGAKKGQIVC